MHYLFLKNQEFSLQQLLIHQSHRIPSIGFHQIYAKQIPVRIIVHTLGVHAKKAREVNPRRLVSVMNFISL